MYLKSVDIVGFKSFADRTRIDLRPGIIGVVGPNGCGKSNVMESIRWCIGEMSWKSLRSASMVQVIFAGTSKRSPLNMAEVTLTFDNASTMLPVEYSEVQVTRRIFRSGESEYLLNKTQCRLRDIRELFLDTGLGGEGYAIIDQGNVDFVLSSKPEERRSLFEEAAGVAKYKAKREEALRKLERVDQDMARLHDQISLLAEQQAKLEKEASKARLFEKYKAQLALQEAAGFVKEVETMTVEIAQIEGRLEPIRSGAADTQVEIDRAAAELATLNIERVERENEVLRFNEGLATLKEEAGRLEERVRHAEVRRTDLAHRSESLALEIEADRARAAALAPDLEKLDGELAAVAERRAALESEREARRTALEAAKAEFDTIDQRVAEAEDEASRRNEERQALSREVSRVESDYQHLQVETRSALRDLEKTQLRLKTANEALEGLRLQAGAAKAAAAEAGALTHAAETTRDGLREKLTAVETETVEVRTGLAECVARLEAVRAFEEGDPTLAASQAVVRAGLPGVLGQLRQLIEVDAASAAFAEEALGPQALGSVVVEDVTAAEGAIEWLKAQQKGRARFVVLSALPTAPAPVALPTGARSLLAAMASGTPGERLANALVGDVFRLGTTVHGKYWLWGGSEEVPQARGLLEERNWASQRETLEGRLGVLEGTRARLKAELSEAEQAAVRSASAQRTADVAAREAELALADRERASALAAEEETLIEGECTGHLAGISLHLETRKVLRERANELATAVAEAQSLAESVRRTRDEVRGRLAQAKTESEGLESQVRHVESQIGFLNDQKRRLEQTIQSANEACARREQERLEAGTARERLTEELDAAKSRLNELGAELSEEENRSKKVFEALEAARAASSSKERELSGLKDRFTELQNQTHEIELELSGRRTREEVARTRLFEACGSTFEEAKAKYGTEETSPDEIAWLRNRIEKLGNVNMTAPEEMEALKQRHDFLHAQAEDLHKAKEDLKSAIGKINANTRENFRHTFELVQGHFRRIYGTLFEGGEADLVLTQPDNLLETGIDIVAQPPGKRLQSISQLSGGEKALTALALLFAFFSVKPSPFCMLDEADAALDDANVERFARLIKDFASKTQFIVISHNKRTMEAAELIYGVTMEESGVSQLISVELQRRPKPETASEGAAAASA